MAPATELLHLRDAYLREFTATVVDAAPGRLLLDRTAFYATGGGQPHDLGTIDGHAVTNVVSDGTVVWHEVACPVASADVVHGVIDWSRRHQLMRTHSAMHVLNGVVWNRWRALATGNAMEPLSGRIDYQFAPLPDALGATIEAAINAEIAADRPIVVSFLDGSASSIADDLIRTRTNLVPESVTEVRVVDIVGLDRQSDGGTHVRSTAEIGWVRITKTESNGKFNRRIRFEVVDV